MKSARSLSRREFVRYASAGAASTCLIGCAPGGRTEPKTRQARAVPKTGGDKRVVDPNDWDALAAVALERVRRAGAEYGDIRLIESTTQSLRGQDRRIASVGDRLDRGFGVRVLYNGAWGFASSSVVTGDEVRNTADLAIEIAKSSAPLMIDPVRLAPEPVHRDTVVTPREIDPFTVALEDKAALLLETMELLHKQDGVRRSNASLWTRRDVKLFASTEGSHIRFDLLASHAGFGATAVYDGRFASRSFGTPYLRAGYELVQNAGLLEHAARIAAEAVEKVRAPRADAGNYDLVLDPLHLALTIHESCGHPTELDRALGYEANYAGTSFLTPEKLGKFRYGSKHVNLTADNTEPGGLASTGYDDDGVQCQRWDIVREGVFVGYSTTREVAAAVGEARSRGSSRADGWNNIPILRISNIGLEPGDATLDQLIGGVKRGIYIEGRGSYSIDSRRLNFQFGGDAFWAIENGERTHMLRDVIYSGITPEFWASCDGVADRAHRKPYGFISCGKGQPGQSGWMTHASAHARFRGVNVNAGTAT